MIIYFLSSFLCSIFVWRFFSSHNYFAQSILGGTLGSRHGTSVDFDKICVFCGKCYVCIDKCVFIVVKVKFVNSDRISDI